MVVAYENPALLGEPLGKYSHVSRAGDLVLVAGQVGVVAGGSLAGADFRSQMRQVFANLRAALESTGGGLENVMKFTTYLVSADLISQFYEVREELFPELYPLGKYPPNTLLVIDRLVKPEFLLEIGAIAYVPASGASEPA
jgi:enamine deaminase RidA (YjgF/YER057c/UK114 family)